MIYTTMDSNVKPEAKVAKKKKKVRNPRITVCYSPEDYATILEESTKAGIKKSQYIHDKSLEIMLYQLMNDEQTKALISAQWKFSGDKHKSLQVYTERTFHQRYLLVML